MDEQIETLQNVTREFDKERTDMVFNLAAKAYKAGFKGNNEDFNSVFNKSYETGLFVQGKHSQTETDLRKVYWDVRDCGKTDKFFGSDPRDIEGHLGRLVNQC